MDISDGSIAIIIWFLKAAVEKRRGIHLIELCSIRTLSTSKRKDICQIQPEFSLSNDIDSTW